MTISQYDLLALMPCPIKVPFDKKIHDYLKAQQLQGIHLNCNITANVNNHEALPNKEIFNQLKKVKSLEDLPKIILTTGLNSLFYSDFTHRFIGKGYFEEVLGKDHTRYSKYAYRDPKKEYTLFTVNPLVMVINLKKYGDQPMPTRWDCLIDPKFSENIVIRGNDQMYCETVMLSLCKDYGIESMKQLKINLKSGLHPAQMVKEITQKREEAATIYVMPYFFALKLRHNTHFKVLWPEDGALANPISMLVRRDASEEVKALARYITGSEIGQVFSDAQLPVLHNQVDHSQYEGKALKWIGWETIENEAIGEMVAGLNNYFLRGGNLYDIKTAL